MEKVYKGHIDSTPKTSLEIEALLDLDMKAEAELLKNLVVKALNINLEEEVQVTNRMAEAKKQLAELDYKIQNLDIPIDKTKGGSFVQQLNDLIDAENKVFQARQELRFFKNEQAPIQVDTLDDIFQELASSIDILSSFEENYHVSLLESHDLFYTTQVKIARDVITVVSRLFDDKRKKILQELSKLTEVYSKINQLESDFYSFAEENITQFSEVQSQSSAHFTDIDDDSIINEKIKTEYDEIVKNLKAEEKQTTKQYEEDKAKVIKTYQAELEALNKSQKDKLGDIDEDEKSEEELLKEELKSIRLEIITAEKKNNFSLVSKLMKKYDKLEKSLSNDKMFSLEYDESAQVTTKIRLDASSLIYDIEKKYATDINRINYSIALEKIKFDEDRMLHKIKADYDGLENDLITNKNRIDKLREFVDMKLIIGSRINEFKLQLRLAELEIIKDSELHELSVVDEYKSLLLSFKKVENSRTLRLNQILNSYALIKTEETYEAHKTIEDIKLTEELHNIEKSILKKQNEAIIQNEITKRAALSEISFQELLIEIANKEHELVLYEYQSKNKPKKPKKVVKKDNSTNSSNLNGESDEASTLLEEMEAIEQQMQQAQNDYKGQVDTISLNLKKELDTLNAKISTLRQKFDFKKSEILKELEVESEDLNFKLMLFTDEKDHLEITKKLEALKQASNEKILEVNQAESEDKELSKYFDLIQAAKDTAKAESEEAAKLKIQKIASLEEIYEEHKEKYDSLTKVDDVFDKIESLSAKENNQAGETPVITKNSVELSEKALKAAIVEPLKIIAEKREFLKQIDNSSEVNLYIKEQIAHKNEIVSTHDKTVEALLHERDSQLNSFTKDIEDLAKRQEADLDIFEDALTESIMYRTQEDIENQYVTLGQKEQDLHKKRNRDLETYKQEFLGRQEKTSKSLSELISASLIPYKEYIDFASKGLVSTKRELEHEFEKSLQEKISDITDRYKGDALL